MTGAGSPPTSILTATPHHRSLPSLLRYSTRVSHHQHQEPDKSRNPVILAALIGAAGVIIAAIITAGVATHGGSTQATPISPTSTTSPSSAGAPSNSSTAPPSPSPHSAPNSSGSLSNIPQTPGGRQNSGTFTYNGKSYPNCFQLDVPGGTSTSYSYNLNNQWSEINLMIYSPSGGSNAAEIGVSVALGGQTASSNNFLVPGIPYSDQFSVAGVRELTISFDNSATLSAVPVLVAGSLSH